MLSQKLPIKKISVAPNFFIHHDYFEQLFKFFQHWNNQEIKRIEKKAGKGCTKRIKRGEIPIGEKAELAIKKKFKDKDFKKREHNEMKCFLALVNLNDVASRYKAFYHSFLLYIFSEFETIIDGVCSEFALREKLEIKCRDLAGKGVERSLIYMKKVARFQLPDGKLIAKIILIRDIRNCLAHSAGEIKNDDLVKRLKKETLLDIRNDDYSTAKIILFDERYCRYVIKTMEQFLFDLVRKNSRYLWN